MGSNAAGVSQMFPNWKVHNSSKLGRELRGSGPLQVTWKNLRERIFLAFFSGGAGEWLIAVEEMEWRELRVRHCYFMMTGTACSALNWGSLQAGLRAEIIPGALLWKKRTFMKWACGSQGCLQIFTVIDSLSCCGNLETTRSTLDINRFFSSVILWDKLQKIVPTREGSCPVVL